MEGYLHNGKLYLNVTNMQDFKSLIEQAKEEAKQLNKTIQKLEDFQFEIKLSEEECISINAHHHRVHFQKISHNTSICLIWK